MNGDVIRDFESEHFYILGGVVLSCANGDAALHFQK